MADIITKNQAFFDELLSPSAAKWSAGVAFDRSNGLPLDQWSVFQSLEKATEYLSNAKAYPGQVIAYAEENGEMTVCVLSQNAEGTALTLKPVGVIPEGDNRSIDMSTEDVISLHNFGKVFYKYVAEEEDVPAHYEKVEVSESAPWVAGLEPKVVTEDGKLVLGWFEPNPTTIEGVNDQVTAVQGSVADISASLGAPSAEGQEATGLYKEVEDVQADVEELVDVIGSEDDSLSEDVKTVWANINDQAGRLEALEAFDHSVYATKEELSAEADRADKAEKANAAAIKAIADDYLKAEHIANMATDAEVEAAVKAEADRAKGVEEGLQNQINLIMNNPDTENVINSINEFTQYIEDHGEIADGFRTDIDKNKEDIAAEAEAARVAEGALSGRLDVLEAIDHDAYIAADTALKNELNVEIAKKADAEQVATDIGTAKQAAIDAAAGDATSKANAAKEAAIADADAKLALKANSADVYAKGETYSQAEVNALLDGIQAGSSESAASVNTKLEALKKTLNTEIYGNEEGTGDSRIDTAETKLAGIAAGAQVNVIESVVAAENAKITAVKTDKEVVIDDSALVTLINNAQTKANEAYTAGTNAQAAADANALVIAQHNASIEAILGVNEQQATAIGELKAHDAQHKGEYEALIKLVTENGTAISGLQSSKADATVVTELAGQVAANTTNIGILDQNIQTVNALALTKANAADVYTKDEIAAITGEVIEGKTIVGMIAEAKAEATYDDTAIKALIKDNADAIVALTDGAVKDNTDAIASLTEQVGNLSNIMNFVGAKDAVPEDNTGYESGDVIIVGGQEYVFDGSAWQAFGDASINGALISALDKRVEANETAIAAINHEETGILALAKTYTNNAIAAIPTASTNLLGLVKYDGKTINMNADNQLYVAEVSTDLLVQGSKELRLCAGGSTI